MNINEIILSPICLFYKYKYEKKIRNIFIQYYNNCNINSLSLNYKYLKFSFYPLTLKYFNCKYSDCENEMHKNLNKIIYESKEEQLLEKFNFIFLINDVYELLNDNFISFTIFNKNYNSNENILKKEIFFIVKDYNLFEVYKKNNFGIIFHVINSQMVEIYPNFYINENNNENGTLRNSIELMIKIKKFFIIDYNINNFLNETEKNLFIKTTYNNQNKTGQTICEQLINIIQIIQNFN
jgi:hypothetical protein